MRVAIIDCGAGNLHSVRKAIGARLPEGAALDVTTDAATVKNATHIVLPGVGAFADCMQGLHALPGMREVLEQKVHQGTTPFLGICVGMQMLFERGYEHGVHEGLGWFKGEVKPIAPANPALKIPHMGWNQLLPQKNHAVLQDIAAGEHVYFVHSYAAQGASREDILASIDYGGEIVAVIGTQFHPEKSQRVGLRLISNFLSQ